MNDQFCEHENAVIRAARSGKWEPSLRAHVDSCKVCREAAKVASAMSAFAMVESAQIPAIPDPRRVWLKASFAERQKRSAMITRIAGVAYAALAAACGLGAYKLVGSGFNGDLSPLPLEQLPTSSTTPFLVILVSIVLVLVLSSSPHKRSR